MKLTRTDIDNAAWSPSVVESQIAVHLPTAGLSRLSLTAFFGTISRPIEALESEGGLHLNWGHGREGIDASQPRNNHSLLGLLSLLDSAFSSLLIQSLVPAAPCVFSPGYLEVR